MRVSLILFPMGPDRISALVLDLDRNEGWKRYYSSFEEVICGLQTTGLITALEATELQSELNFDEGSPVFRGSTEQEDLEDAGFCRVLHRKPN